MYMTDKGLRKTEYGNMKEWNAVFNGNINADIIIQGNSRAWTGYNTYLFDSLLNTNSYNLGIDGCPFDIQYARFKAYVEKNEYPKLIIQNVDHITMSRNMAIFDKYQFLPYLNNQEIQKQLIINKIPKADIYMPILKYSGQYKYIQIGLSEFFQLKHYESRKYKGYFGQDMEWDGTNLNNLNEQNKKIEWAINKGVQTLFIAFLNECKENNVKVVLVYAPIYTDALALFDNESVIKYYKELSFEQNICFFDFSNDSISLHKEFFYNAAHLNKKGSVKFTNKLVNMIDSVIKSEM